MNWDAMTPADLDDLNQGFLSLEWLTVAGYPQNIHGTAVCEDFMSQPRGRSGLGRDGIRRPVSRVLCRPPKRTRRSFLWTDHCWTVLATYPDASGQRRPCPDGRGVPIRSCSRRGLPCRPGRPVRGGLLPHPFTLALRSPRAKQGGLLSVALSLGSPPAGVTRRLVAVEPGLSSPRRSGERPPGRLIRRQGGRDMRPGQADADDATRTLLDCNLAPASPCRGVGGSA